MLRKYQKVSSCQYSCQTCCEYLSLKKKSSAVFLFVSLYHEINKQAQRSRYEKAANDDENKAVRKHEVI